MKHLVKADTTDYTVLVWLGDSSSTTGAGLASVAYDDITVYYARVETDNDVTSAQLTTAALSALTDAHSDGGWFEVDSTNQPGLYRLDLSDAILASGAWTAVVTIIDAGSNNIAPANMEFELVGYDPFDAVKLGLSAFGNITGSGMNTILGYFQSAMRNNVVVSSDIGGTYEDGSHSLQALRANLDSYLLGMNNLVLVSYVAVDALSTSTTIIMSALSGYADSFFDNNLLVIYDSNNDRYLSRWIDSWASNIATVADLGYTPDTFDTVTIFAIRRPQTAAEINAEVVDALATDTYAEPGQGAPAATLSIADKVNYLFKAWRNKFEQTATTASLYNDAGDTVDQQATVSDDGTTFTKGEMGSG